MGTKNFIYIYITIMKSYTKYNKSKKNEIKNIKYILKKIVHLEIRVNAKT